MCHLGLNTNYTETETEAEIVIFLTNHTTIWKTNVLLNYQIIKNLPKIYVSLRKKCTLKLPTSRKNNCCITVSPVSNESFVQGG